MSNTQKDDNDYPAIFGISCIDGTTPTRIAFNAATGAMKVDQVTVTSFTPFSPPKVDGNSQPVAKALSTDGVTVLPWYVNPSTNAVLVG